MRLDVQTLSVVTVFVTALLGVLLVFAGLQNRAVRAPMIWGAAFIVSAVGLALLTTHGSAPDWISINSANALVLLGYGLTWAGARIFDARPVRPGLVLAAPALWLLASAIPAFAADINLRVVALAARNSPPSCRSRCRSPPALPSVSAPASRLPAPWSLAVRSARR